MSRPLLIVTADDLGYDEATTDAILECFAAGAVTCASAMVFMADSERAARLAREHGLPVGLHLNLSEAFTAPAVAPEIARRQARLLPHFTDRGRRLRNWCWDPFVARGVAAATRDQVIEFSRLYGRGPDHVDGHRHVHVCLNVAFTRALAPGRTTRRALRQFDGGALRGPRRLRQRALDRRARTTDFLVPFSQASPDRLDLARRGSLEVMTHPGLEEERERLLSPAWRDGLAPLQRGDFGDL
jgi:hypothetical protein